MSRNVSVALYVIAMIAVIVGVDLLFFRDRFHPRLIANLCILAAFGAGYFLFFMRR